ncbi:MAG: haloacid dehalogenase-like hydrolase [Patescibacteria group bacterium]
MVFIPNEKELFNKVAALRADGVSRLLVLADFDRTFTKAFVDGQKSPSVIAQLRNENVLTPDYAPRAHALFDHYHPLEINPSIPRDQKESAMREWWVKHFELLVECGLTQGVMREVVARKTLRFRDGAMELLDTLREKSVPLVIMSAGLGFMIEEYLRQEGRLTANVAVVANQLEFSNSGKFSGIREPLIHSLNKNKILLQDFPVFEAIKNRTSVILLGDSLDDVGMVDGFPHRNLIKIGFLNEEDGELREQYAKVYDIILTNDAAMHFISEIFSQIINL